ncbi:MAG: redoxin domain-containing protein [Candidatus Hydrogenedentes bacterium]|nr:redoxin domain-containing protein [Candidatus Hydrogenedentota bacterium]
MKRISGYVTLGVALAVAWVVPASFGAQLGDPAGALQVGSWIKGDPVTLADLKGKKVAVVEFWATWCPPCRQSIPHLTKLQQEYKDDVVFIGVTDEDAAVVKPFVEKMGDQMSYRVAIDQEQKTTRAYMQAFKIQGIPHAFIIDKEGKVAYKAHPMESDFEEALKQIVAGRFDAKALEAQAKQREENLEKAQNLLHLLARGDNPEEAKKLGQEVLQLFSEDAEILGQIAWIIASQDMKQRDLDLALKAAEKADTLTKQQNAQNLTAHARVLFEQGNQQKALQLQKKAIGLAQSPEEKQFLEEQLQLIETGKPAATQ